MVSLAARLKRAEAAVSTDDTQERLLLAQIRESRPDLAGLSDTEIKGLVGDGDLFDLMYDALCGNPITPEERAEYAATGAYPARPARAVQS